MVEQFSQFSKFTTQLASQFNSPLPPQFAAAFDVEFTPSPEVTNQLILESYQIPRNLLVKFTNDDIDQTRSLHGVLLERFPDLTSVQILKGNHLTPLGQDINWQAGKEFTPFDALGQFFKQEFYRDLNQLKQTILMWLNPLESLR